MFPCHLHECDEANNLLLYRYLSDQILSADREATMSKRLIVVAYDIPNNKRRTKLHQRLKEYGSAVQYSVFECLVTREEFVRMKAMVRAIIKPRLDHVRYYPLCGSCQPLVESTRAEAEPLHEAEFWIV